MGDIDQFKGNRPMFLRLTALERCLASLKTPALPKTACNAPLTQIKSASCRFFLDFREYGNPLPDYELYNSCIRAIKAPYSQTV